MIVDARCLPVDAVIDCDVCIVGAGAAGISVAHELRNCGLNVVLLEGGGLKYDARAQDLYKGEVLDPAHHGPLDQYRKRQFGGTTTVWGGQCAPFDEIDFERRSHVPYSGWPITKQELDPYYARAHEYCELGAYTYLVPQALPGSQPEMIPGFQSDNVCTDYLWRFSPPTDFGRTFWSALSSAPKLKVYLHANCLRIRASQSGRSVVSLKDIFGINKLKVDWCFGELDFRSVIKSCQMIGNALQESGTGKMMFRPEDMTEQICDNTGVGSHHLGTTRMASDPSRGVVDPNCRVHGIDNLYIASGSVFPTVSFTNPTLTIVALAIRLGDHLKQLG